jgi:hypothetical protein
MHVRGHPQHVVHEACDLDLHNRALSFEHLHGHAVTSLHVEDLREHCPRTTASIRPSLMQVG